MARRGGYIYVPSRTGSGTPLASRKEAEKDEEQALIARLQKEAENQVRRNRDRAPVRRIVK